eukprot:2709357-Amphidinium_carterae.2
MTRASQLALLSKSGSALLAACIIAAIAQEIVVGALTANNTQRSELQNKKGATLARPTSARLLGKAHAA